MDNLIKVNTKIKKEKGSFFSNRNLAISVFLLAFCVRLAFLFFFTEIDKPSIGDVWHHWQIAYLSKTVGFKQEFLRLWDFKGMEYYWGLLHPLVLIAGFLISGSLSIVVPRIVSVLFGSGVAALIFLIVARHYGRNAALASSLLVIFLPTAIFHDSLGLQEPLGLFFLLLGVFLYPQRSFSAGFCWMLSGMARAEYWIFGAALLLVVIVREKNLDRKITALVGYLIPCIFYMKYLLDKTGNAIYPVYWNYLVIGSGEWSARTIELTGKYGLVETVSQVLAVLFFILALVIFLKKGKSYLFLLVGLFNFIFVFVVLGFGSYIAGFVRVPSEPGIIDKIWIGKMFAFPWVFLGVVFCVLFFFFLPRKFGKQGSVLGFSFFMVLIMSVQFVWPSIDHFYLKVHGDYEINRKSAELIAQNYSGMGKIILPNQSEFVTYFLVYEHGIGGEKLIASFYSPFYYYEGGDPYSEWDTFRDEISDWLERENAELFMASRAHEDYKRMFELEEGKLFEHIGEIGVYSFYRVYPGK